MIRSSARRISLLSLLALSLPVLIGLALPELADAQERTYRIRRDGGSRITFVSDAPLETINGVSSELGGALQIDPRDLGATRGTVSVPVSSIRTGVDLRDEHLRGDTWLDAAHHPDATFQITGVSGASTLEPNQEARLRISGRFTIHGVTRALTARARVIWIPLTDEMRRTPGINGDVIRARARFTIQLTDFGISVPSIVRLKVSNEIVVTVNLRAIAE
ncbi:MAG: YceI family protein [Myxococcales bacterium]|nr:YceI family protein [Myxococcales bacterium]